MSSLSYENLHWTGFAGQQKLFLWEIVKNFWRLLGKSEFLPYWYLQSKPLAWHLLFCSGKELALSRGYLYCWFGCLTLCSRTQWPVCVVLLTAKCTELVTLPGQTGLVELLLSSLAFISLGIFLCCSTCLVGWVTWWLSQSVQGSLCHSSPDVLLRWQFSFLSSYITITGKASKQTKTTMTKNTTTKNKTNLPHLWTLIYSQTPFYAWFFETFNKY